MKAAGLRAFEKRDETGARKRTRTSGARRRLTSRVEQRFRQNAAAWDFFQAQPPGYRRLLTFMVMSGKKEETREKRLDRLIAACASRRRIPLM